MPELPEVETIKNELVPYVIGRRIGDITLLWDRMVRQPSAEEFRSHLVGQGILELSRRGKYMIFSLTGGEVLIIHLKMTGSLLVKPAAAEPEKYVRAILHLDNEHAIHFRDPRKFGSLWLVPNASLVIGKLGPEPLEPDFTPRVMTERLDKRSVPIKALLCDQSFVAGIGNMYADEVLYAAKIHPLRLGNSLSREEIEQLHRAIQLILQTAIEDKGASVEDYFRPDGGVGKAHFRFQVAHRLSGELCPTHGTPTERIVVRGRGTYFCPRCQPQQV